MEVTKWLLQTIEENPDVILILFLIEFLAWDGACAIVNFAASCEVQVQLGILVARKAPDESKGSIQDFLDTGS